MMLKVGLTGNIGSGKTIVAGIFTTLGVPVFHADKEARKLFSNEGTRKSIREIFGPGVFSPSGEVIRPVLAEVAFSNPKLLNELNALIHPQVRDNYKQWCFQHSDSPYTLYEAAILFESGHYKEMDKVICVTAPEQIRVKRVMERDHLTVQEIEKRMANQWEEEKKIRLSDYVIRNDETCSVIMQVMEVHKKIVQSS